MVQLTQGHSHVRNMISPANVIVFDTEGTNLSWRARLLSRAAEGSLGCTAHHSTPPTLAYKFSIRKAAAFAIR